jgi:hypothetical protein
MSEAYTVRGREIYSARGKLVAKLDADGNPVMEPGMAGPHSAKVRAFLERQVQTALDFHEDDPTAEENTEVEPAGPATEPAEQEGATLYVGQIPAARAEGGAPSAPKAEPETMDEYTISTIPEDSLPPFSCEYGVNTPGFMEFCDKHKLTAPQVAALIIRLQNIKKGKQNGR